MAEERWPALPAAGGFARLRREGLTVRELDYAHAVTDTAPGHAALYAGAVPRATGLAANETLGPDGKRRSILVDEATRLVDVSGARLDRPGSSLARLRGDTLADALVAAAPGAAVYSFSLKDRGALPAAGRRPTAALWLDVASGAFVTSTAFATPPAWAAPLADRAAVTRARAAGWTLAPDERAWVEAHARPRGDDAPGEGDLDGLGRTFPHAIPTAKALRATPAGDRLVLALARAALDQLGRAPGDAPALLALSLSANDYVNHVFGPQSFEAWAELRELDRGLAELFAAADRAVGPDGWAALLTSDHGGGTLPEAGPFFETDRMCPPHDKPWNERWERACLERRRLMPAPIVAALEAAAKGELGEGPWIAGFAEPLVVLTARGRALAGDARARLLAAAKKALWPLGIQEVVDARHPPPCDPRDDAASSLLGCAIDPDGPGDLYLAPFAGAFFDADLTPGFGENHGSLYLYDRAVPLLVRAPGRVPAGAERDVPVSFTAFARTAAALLGVPPPAAAADGLDLTTERAR
jgi:hypothetical protein